MPTLGWIVPGGVAMSSLALISSESEVFGDNEPGPGIAAGPLVASTLVSQRTVMVIVRVERSTSIESPVAGITSPLPSATLVSSGRSDSPSSPDRN